MTTEGARSARVGKASLHLEEKRNIPTNDDFRSRLDDHYLAVTMPVSCQYSMHKERAGLQAYADSVGGLDQVF